MMFTSLYRGPFHRERRAFIRVALAELNLLLSDSPGLMGPKVSMVTGYLSSSSILVCILMYQVKVEIRINNWDSQREKGPRAYYRKLN